MRCHLMLKHPRADRHPFCAKRGSSNVGHNKVSGCKQPAIDVSRCSRGCPLPRSAAAAANHGGNDKHTNH